MMNQEVREKSVLEGGALVVKMVDLVTEARALRQKISDGLEKPGMVMVPLWARELMRDLARTNQAHAEALAELSRAFAEREK